MPLLTFCFWLALVWGAGWIFLPVAKSIFGDILPDGGLAVGRVLFLALWALGAYWIGHAGVPVSVSAWLYGVLAIGAVLWSKRKRQSGFKPSARALRASDAAFLATFLLFFAFRSFWSETDGNNGEKSMDSALIGSLSRAQKLPPPNPYAAGSNLRGYYYFGHLETALLTDATGTSTRWSYNLMCATLPALCFSTLFSLGAGLTGRLLGGFFVSIVTLGLGTLEPIIQWRNPSSFGSSTPFRLDFFATSRVIPFSINEYPWFTFNQADLHAHYFDLPFALATMCLAYAIFRGRKAALPPIILLLGVQVMTNTWDFPAYLTVAALAILGTMGLTLRAPDRDKKVRDKEARELTRSQTDFTPIVPWLRFGIVMLVAVGALIVAAPYLLNLKTAANRPKLLHQPVSPLREWLVLWGPFVAAWLSFLSYSLFTKSWQRFAALALSIGVLVFAALRTTWFNAQPNLYQPSPLVLPIIAAMLGLSIGGAWKLRETPRFLCFLAIGGLIALLWSETTWAGFLGDINNPGFDDFKRQDTVFKFGLQVWMLWGVAVSTGMFVTLKKWPEALQCCFIIAVPIMVISSTSATFGRTHNFTLWTSRGQWAGLQGRDQTDPYYVWNGWDGWAHMKAPEQAAAAWLLANTPPGQNLIEAENRPGGDYSIYTRYAHATGIPTVIGPQAHSFQWSPANSGDAGKEWDEVFRRKEAVRTLYLAADPYTKHDIAARYGVAHIVWGELERTEYGDKSLEDLRATCRQEAKFGADNDPHQVWIFAPPTP